MNEVAKKFKEAEDKVYNLLQEKVTDPDLCRSLQRHLGGVFTDLKEELEYYIED